MNGTFLFTAIFSAIVAVTVSAPNALAGDRISSGEAEIAMMDANRDGRLSADEHAAGAKQKFSRMDADHDSNVTASEMDAAQASMKKSGHVPSNKMSSADKIKVVDTDGDGVLSVQEHETGSRRMFEKMDTDRDGALTAAEITAGHKTMMKTTH